MRDDIRTTQTTEHIENVPADGQHVEQVTTTESVSHMREPQPNLFKITNAIWLLTGILESLIGIRVFLKLIAANPDAGFAQFIYSTTGVFLVPFNGLTATPEAGGSVLELSSLIAMVVYLLIAWLVVRVLWLVATK